MATRRTLPVKKAIERALLARDRLEIRAIERLLTVSGGAARVRVRARAKTRRPAR